MAHIDEPHRNATRLPARTLIHLLRRRAERHPERPAYVFLKDGETEEVRLGYGELEARARAVAAALDGCGAAGTRALLLYPPGLDFVTAFLGCLYAGVVAVPAAAPAPGRAQPRLSAIARDAGAGLVLAPAAVARQRESLAAFVPELAGLPWIATDGLEAAAAPAWRKALPGPETLAFLQYTSGSTSSPKGVMVTHGNLVHNQEVIRRVCAHREGAVVVSWLPVFHDMGLIAGVLQPLFTGGLCVSMSPVAFLQRPSRWLAAISRYRGETSGGPNFAYELCLRKVDEEAKAGLDLTCWRTAFDGSEPVRAETLERFARAFASCGFDRSALYPCYGLAESTLFVTGGRPGAGPVVETVSPTELRRNRVAPPAGEPGQEVVSCGHPWLGQEVAIVDPDTLKPAAPGRVGEIWVAGPSVARGYWNRPAETARDFGARLAGEPERGPFLRTGDLGFAAGEDLFVTGRLKDLLILRGRNHYPQDVELSAERSHPALRPGAGAAFTVLVGAEERLVVVQEIERRREAEAEAAADALRRAVALEHDLNPYDVLVVRAGTVPKTTSGKVQRRACRDLYETGALAPMARRRAAAVEAPGTAASLSVEEVLGLPVAERPGALAAYLRQRAAEAIGVPAEGLPLDRPLVGLGLDSLAAVRLEQEVEGDLGVVLPREALLAGVDLAGLAARLGETLTLGDGAAGEAPTLGPAGGALSAGQSGLWFLDRLAPGSAAYTISAAAVVRSPLDVAALGRAAAALARRHPALRTVFETADGEPRQRLLAGSPLRFEVEDATAASEAEIAGRLLAVAEQPFDLAAGPLFRLAVWRRQDHHVLLVAMHHIVSDFWSMGILAGDLAALYRREVGIGSGPPPASALSPADFARWQERRLAGERGEALFAFWRQALAGAPPRLELPTDRPRPAAPSFRGGGETRVLAKAPAGAVRALASRLRVTPFNVVFAALATFLARHCGQEDLTVGVPTAGRERAAFAGVVGYFVNPVVLRADCAGEPAFTALVARVRRSALAAFAHGDLPFPLLAERLGGEREPGLPPLFQVMLVFQEPRRPEERGLLPFALGLPGARLDLGGLELESLPVPRRTSQLDLTLSVAEIDGALAARLEYSADLFDAATARRLLDRFHALLAGAVRAPETRLQDLPLLLEAERRQLLDEWGQAPLDAPEGICLHQLFARQAVLAPGAVALVHGDERLSYAELATRVERLAAVLRRAGVGPETRVGVLLERSPAAVVALLAVLAAGGAYVALDPAYPAERIAFMLADSGAPVVVTREGLARRFGLRGQTVIAPEVEDAGAPEPARPGPPPQSGNLAYVIYTSGSTGRPKGVGIEHRSAVRFLAWARTVFSPEDLRGVLACTSFCFDLSIFELFAPLSTGGAVILADDALALDSLPARGEVTLVNTVPSAMAALVSLDALPLSVRTVNLAGEPLPGALAHRIHATASSRRLLNLYGPSECTTYSTFAVVQRNDAAPSIGRPIGGTRVVVLDSGLGLVPPGAVGEIFLGGEGLARGYLGRADVTAERFVPDPFGARPGDRLYRTGDLAQHRADGSLHLLGRFDQQVKLRGFRIELGEIERTLAAHPEVGEAVVALERDAGGEPELVAFVAAAGADGAPGPELQAHLRRWLPEYMVPAHFVFVGALPRTPNGKVDRRALPRWRPQLLAAAKRVRPRTPVEETVAAIWAAVLGREVGDTDSFFAVGGHSLKAMQVVSRVRDACGVELPVGSLFAAPTVAAFARRVEDALRQGAEVPPPLTRAPRDGPLPLSFAQQRLWFLDRLEPDTPAYLIPAALQLAGPLRPAALAASLRAVVRRHESLRTSFPCPDGAPVQWIAAAADLALPVVDLRGVPAARREAVARRVLERQARRPIALERGPLLRCLLLRLAAERHVLLVTIHHCVCDGWSLELLLAELAALYRAGVAGEPPRLPALRCQYADYAVWQRRLLAGAALAGHLDFWRQELAGIAPLELAGDRPRPAAQSFRGAALVLPLGAPLAAAVGELARGETATPFLVVLAAFASWLWRATGQEDFTLGVPVAGRSHSELEPLIGCFVNTLVVRARPADDLGFRELLARARQTMLAAYSHQDVPFERLVEELRPERTLGRSPLFQVMVSLRTQPAAVDLGGVRLTPLRVERGAAHHDLALELVDGGGGTALALEYSTDLFDRSTVWRIGRQLEALLAAAAADPSRALADLALLAPGERQQLLVEWSGQGAAVPPATLLHRLVEVHARTRPDAVAVTGPDGELSYGELWARAAELATALRRRGAGPEEIVALAARRSPAMVVGMVGIPAAGAAFLPLDPEWPPARLEAVLAESRARFLLSERALASRLPSGGPEPLFFDQVRQGVATAETAGGEVDPDNAAYVIFTSGSTGGPKGVVISHRAIAAYSRDAAERFAITPADRILQFASPGFDASLEEIFGCLVAGGTLVLRGDAGPVAPGDLLREVACDGVTVLDLPTGYFHELAAEVAEGCPLPACLRALVIGGERVLPARWRAWRAGVGRVRLFNTYGPTESTIVATSYEEPGVAAGLAGAADVPIGRPVTSCRTYVVGAGFVPAPQGAVGELWLCGPGLARGYCQSPDLTAERFVPNPCASTADEAGSRLYRTGDLVRYRADGELEFRGRADRQLKVRGFRVEPAEIETALAGHPRLREVAVERVGGTRGPLRLLAYVVPSAGESPSEKEVRAFLAERLPDFMVPAAVVLLDRLPRNANGKIDRRALRALAPERAAPTGGRAAAPPRTPVEELLAGVWEEVLGVGGVGGDDSFFDLGGHSLLATRITARIRQALGVKLPVRSLFETPTLTGLAARVEASLRPLPAEPIQPARRGGELPLSAAQERLWFLAQLDAASPIYDIPAGLRLRGRLDAAALARALAALVARHESLRTTLGENDRGPFQSVAPAGTAWALPRIDLAGLDAAEAEALRLARREAARPFDLAAGPLFRATLLRVAAADHLLLLNLHHVIADGWSLDLLTRELGEVYAAGLAGREAPLPALPIQYADYAAWQRRRLAQEAFAARLARERARLAGAPFHLELPTDRPRPAVQSLAGAAVSAALGPALAAGLRRLGRRSTATPFMTLLAGFQALLARHTGETDLLVGTPAANRDRLEVEGVVGLFVNTLVLRGDLAGDPDVAELVRRAREAALDGYASQDVPFERLVAELSRERSLGENPLVQVMFALLAPAEPLRLPGLEVAPVELPTGTAKLDLTLTALDRGDDLSLVLEYSTELFDAATARRLLGRYLALLAGMAESAGESVRRLSELPLLPAPERAQILREWNDTVRPAPRATIHGLFAAQAARTPGARAVSCAGQSLTYAGLERRVHRLARHLAGLGVGRGDLVGLCLERSLDMVVAVLGVLEAGGAYVPLDPSYPRERLAMMLEDARPAVLLTEERVAPGLPAHGARLVVLDRLAAPAERERVAGAAERPLDPIAGPEDLAYVLFTSGSTGRPKGVQIPHGAVVNFLLSVRERPGFAAGDRLLAVTSLSFDIAAFDLFLPLVTGAEVEIAPRAVAADGLRLLERVAAGGVTVLQATPATWKLLLEAGWRGGEDLVVLCGGETMPPRLAADLLARSPRVWNFYGPTEATIWSTVHALVPALPGAVPIGRPIANTAVHLLGRALEPVPIGATGELAVGGAGLSWGYLNRPDLTAERFVPDATGGEPGARLYRTGDLARARPDGTLDFLGRGDQQVKVRGHRIELGEIEAALGRHPEVAACAAALRSGPAGEAMLVAYLVARGGAGPGADELRRFLRQRLPEPMLPAAFIALPALPLTPNGKVDRRALPEPAAPRRQTAAPRTEAERRIAEIWRQVLGVEPDLHDNFFDVGGHSLSLLRAHRRLQAAFGREIPLTEMFRHPTVASLGELLARGGPRRGSLEKSFARAAMKRGVRAPRPDLARRRSR